MSYTSRRATRCVVSQLCHPGKAKNHPSGMAGRRLTPPICLPSASRLALSCGKEKALMALFGKCMKQLKGNCDPQVLRTMLIDEINKA